MPKPEIRIVAISAGERYEVNDLKGWTLRSIDGLGIMNISRLSQRHPGQRGYTDLGFAQGARVLTLIWEKEAEDLWHYWDMRAEMLEIFMPRDHDPVQLELYFPNGTVRTVEGNLTGDLDHASSDRLNGVVQRVGATLIAGDPFLRSLKIETEIFSLVAGGGSGAGWAIPWAIPWPIGTSDLSQAIEVLYADGARHACAAFPTIRLAGPISNPVITNETTDETIPLTAEGGLVIASGEHVDVDLEAKTLLDQDDNSVDHFLADDHDLASWHLAPAGEILHHGGLSDGKNIIKVTGDGVTSETTISMNYYRCYAGA